MNRGTTLYQALRYAYRIYRHVPGYLLLCLSPSSSTVYSLQATSVAEDQGRSQGLFLFLEPLILISSAVRIKLLLSETRSMKILSHFQSVRIFSFPFRSKQFTFERRRLHTCLYDSAFRLACICADSIAAVQNLIATKLRLHWSAALKSLLS